MANVLMVVAQNGFRDEEFLVPKEILEKAGHNVKIASITRAKATGMKGLTIQPHMAAYEANPGFFDCIVIVGGPGAAALAENKDVRELVSRASEMERIVAAICLGPLTLAKAGVLRERNATVFPDMPAIQALRNAGAAYWKKPVVQDGHILTADGPHSAGEFGEALVEMLKERKQA
ncbi:MAG: DJ-1/PfpI family protein [Candidatus ainarchaeum sp.]|nr:DJ-1/PfpI family protein [Candidatus ainarchaeum sp.]